MEKFAPRRLSAILRIEMLNTPETQRHPIFVTRRYDTKVHVSLSAQIPRQQAKKSKGSPARKSILRRIVMMSHVRNFLGSITAKLLFFHFPSPIAAVHAW